VIAVLCGGVGAARLLSGLVQVVDPADLRAVVNTGDDTELHGLTICPDLDTITYTLSGAVNPETGWGLVGESWQAMGSLERLGGTERTWFRLGDRDLGTHLYRAGRLAEGVRLTDVANEIATGFGLGVRLLPMSDEPVRTRLRLASGGEVGFQEYFVKLRHGVAVAEVRFEGAESARPTPEVLEALSDASTVVIAPSNPVVSIGPILAVPGVRELLQRRRDDVVAVSPIVGGKALKGPADRLLRELGGEATPVGVAQLLSEVAGSLVLDAVDAGLAGAVAQAGMRPVVTDTVMATPERAAALARVVLGATRLPS
jgi:LPPG:FO 2-phospho-L-lactate transferase